MKWLWARLREYAIIILTMLVAGMITGACAIDPVPRRPVPTPEPMMRVRDCTDQQPIRLMPNHLMEWNPKRLDRRA